MKYKNINDDLNRERMQSKYFRNGRIRHRTYVYTGDSTGIKVQNIYYGK